MSSIGAKRVDIVSVKLVKESSVLYAQRKADTPESVVDLLRPFLVDSDREKFLLLCLDTKNQPTAIHTVSIGSLNSSLVHPREVFKVAILANANAIILAHNHPSGDSTPSNEDIETSKRLVEAGDVLGIKVLDHIIIGDGFVSLKQEGVIS